MKVLGVLILSLLFLASAQPVVGVVDPRDVANNHFGIHIINESDIEIAADLVNSNGGEWGYVTLVIREDDRDLRKWQAVFDHLRRLKLIPLVRLATTIENGGWAKPRQEDIEPWRDFLSSLNWVVKNRYVILFNEPNHANEWGGEVKPDEYAKLTHLFAEKLKQSSQDFFILSAGFDASAANTTTSMSSALFFSKMYEEDPDIFSLFDGWTSHSYPNPDFSGLPLDSGKTSIQGYKWEVAFLTSFGLKQDIPVFITETGWKHQQGKKTHPSYYAAEEVADFFREAFETIWTDPQVVAVTPFVLKYPEEPFAHFSWLRNDKDVYPQYEMVKALPKEKGQPEQVDEGKLIKSILPNQLVINSEYTFTIHFENTGQSIWNRKETVLQITSNLPPENLKISDIPYTQPFDIASFEIYIKTSPETNRTQFIRFQLQHGGEPFAEGNTQMFKLVPPPSLIIKAALGTKLNSIGDDLTLLIYKNGDLMKKIEPVSITNGVGTIDELYDVVPRRNYRFVLLKSYYLPRQTFAYLSPQQTTVSFKRMLPFDPDADGAFTHKDLLAALRHLGRTATILMPFTE